MSLEKVDPKLFDLLQAEKRRQAETLNLIASENFAPPSVREIGASILTNKYTEGYPGNRYYAGCEVFDEIEKLAIDRARQLFGSEYANVQPHSGASANEALFQAVLEPRDKILGLALDHGGHLTHGMKINFSGRFYDAHSYGLDPDTLQIDMDQLQKKSEEIRPKLIIAGWSVYSHDLDFQRFREIADSVGAYLLVDMSHFAGLVAGRSYPDPIPYADFVTSTTHKTLRGPRGGIILAREEFSNKIDKAVFPGQQGGALPQTIAAKAHAFHLAMDPSWEQYSSKVVLSAASLADTLEKRGRRVISGRKTHTFLLDLQGKSGLEAEKILEEQGVVCNRNTIPFEKRPPRDPSGLRFGSPALVTRGFGEKEFVKTGELIDRALSGESVEEEVSALLFRFPLG